MHGLRHLMVLILPVILGQTSFAVAGGRQASLLVNVTVVAVARLQVLEQPPMLTIAPEDIRRGYVDVIDATALAVRSNSLSGFVLTIHPLAEIFKAMRVRWEGHDVEFGSEGGSTVHRQPGPCTAAVRLSYRFLLRPELPPGDYPWPLALSALPL